MRQLCVLMFAFGCLLAAPGAVHAAQSYDSCTGFIDSVPATIATQGVWCLRKNLSTAITSGNAIDIATNNVTIDCNNFKLGGLAAGDGSRAIGIHTNLRQNVTIRHCNIRGFHYGIQLSATTGDGGIGGGHLVEDNRLDNNLFMGIWVDGYNNLVRRNRVYDTGGSTDEWRAYGIGVSGDVIDNTIIGLFTDQQDNHLTGIEAAGNGTRVSGNTISGFDLNEVPGGRVAQATGIFTYGQYMRVSGNQVVGNDGFEPSNGIGISVYIGSGFSAYCLDNTVGGFTNNIYQCDVSDGNLTLP